MLLLLASPTDTFVAAWHAAAAGQPAWARMSETLGDKDLARLARLLEGIHRLGADREDAAVWFATDPPDSAAPFAHRLAYAAKGWRSRLLMKQLAVKLRAYYRDHVEYPPSLSDLPNAPLKDAFGEGFHYAAHPRKLVPDIPRQRFELACATTGVAYDDIDRDLGALYAPVDDVIVRTPEPDRKQVFAKLKLPDGSFSGAVQWRVGEQRGDYVLWAVYGDFVILGQRDVPRVALKQTEP